MKLVISAMMPGVSWQWISSMALPWLSIFIFFCGNERQKYHFFLKENRRSAILSHPRLLANNLFYLCAGEKYVYNEEKT
jgi:hypothetical protein